MQMKHRIAIKRVYDKPGPEDVRRVLVDRLWPRGVTKAAAKIDLWAKEAAPSTELRKWFHEDPARLSKFVDKYLHELDERRNEIEVIFKKIDGSIITLLTATKDPQAGHVPALEKFLRSLL
jgi:uncharacterized protein YeaO (DUF488 family)